MWLARSIAARLAPTALRAVPIITLATLAGWLYWPGPAGAAACAASILAAALLSSAIATFMTLTMFWTISGTGITTLISTVAYLLGGMIIPLPLFPDWLQPVLEFLPFRGLIDTPFRLFLGHIPLERLPWVLGHQLAWIAGIVVVSRWMLSRLVRRLVVQGG
jgi:ABC-2 type transport system permease protein